MAGLLVQLPIISVRPKFDITARPGLELLDHSLRRSPGKVLGQSVGSKYLRAPVGTENNNSQSKLQHAVGPVIAGPMVWKQCDVPAQACHPSPPFFM